MEPIEQATDIATLSTQMGFVLDTLKEVKQDLKRLGEEFHKYNNSVQRIDNTVGIIRDRVQNLEDRVAMLEADKVENDKLKFLARHLGKIVLFVSGGSLAGFAALIYAVYSAFIK